MRCARWRSVVVLVTGLVVAGSMVARAQSGSFAKAVGPVRAGDVQQSTPLRVPFITWGGDMATFYANGGSVTKPGTIFGDLGLSLKLEAGDDFHQQVRDYMSGKSPFLRGTYRMIGMASEVIGSDPRTEGVMIMQLTWSAGDHMVARQSVQKLSDLKGKTVVIQAGGPHVGLLDDILRTARLGWEEIKVVWAQDLTATPNSPAELFKKTETIDACLVITPDMISLCGDLDSEGSGLGGTVKGARVVASTADMKRSIADVYVCRRDFLDANRDMVMKFVNGYFKACEEVNELWKEYSKGNRQGVKYSKYMDLLKLSQSMWGEPLPTVEDDNHGLLCDCKFAGYPGNRKFFEQQGNLVGFAAFREKALELAVGQGYARAKREFHAAGFDYGAPTLTKGLEILVPGNIETTDEVGAVQNEFHILFGPDEMTFPASDYEEDYKAVAQSLATFGNARMVIVGHTCPGAIMKAIKASAKKLKILKWYKLPRQKQTTYVIKGEEYADEEEVARVIFQMTADGVFDSDVENDPRGKLQQAMQLSQIRAQNVKTSIMDYAKDRGFLIDEKLMECKGAGIKEPTFMDPKNSNQRAANRRVVFELRKPPKLEETLGGCFYWE